MGPDLFVAFHPVLRTVGNRTSYLTCRMIKMDLGIGSFLFHGMVCLRVEVLGHRSGPFHNYAIAFERMAAGRCGAKEAGVSCGVDAANSWWLRARTKSTSHASQLRRRDGNSASHHECVSCAVHVAGATGDFALVHSMATALHVMRPRESTHAKERQNV